MNKIIGVILTLLVVGFSVSPTTVGEETSEISGRLIIFHAGSLAVPFKQICKEFNGLYPKIKIFCETAGSRICARKITDLYRPCDVMVSADYTVIDTLLVPEYAKWNIRFAANEMVVAFRRGSRRAGGINRDNWYDILLEKDVAFGRSDPDSDPCGYRAVLVVKLAEEFYNTTGLAERLLAKNRRYIRPKEVDLLALLQAGELDYIFIYRSIAEQHKLKYVALPDQINLKSREFADFYKSVSVRLTGEKPGTFITRTAAPIVYGVTIPKSAVNRKAALAFLNFLLDADKGGAILEKNGQTFVVPSPTDTFDKIPNSLTRFALPEQTVKREL